MMKMRMENKWLGRSSGTFPRLSLCLSLCNSLSVSKYQGHKVSTCNSPYDLGALDLGPLPLLPVWRGSANIVWWLHACLFSSSVHQIKGQRRK